MRASASYPFDALTGSCFITGDYDPANGIVDLEIYLDTLPPNGRLCVSGRAVRLMVTALGWEWPTDELSSAYDTVLEEVERLRSENQRLRKAVSGIVNAAKLAAVEDWMVAT
jgi:phosphoglycerate-specific signal transduction histidine kinase